MRTTHICIFIALLAGIFIGSRFFSPESSDPPQLLHRSSASDSGRAQQTPLGAESTIPLANGTNVQMKTSARTTGQQPRKTASLQSEMRAAGIDQQQPASAQSGTRTKTPAIQETAQTWFERGLALNDDSAQEIALYQKALDLDPEFAPAHYRLGAIYMRRAEFDTAETHFALFWDMASLAQKEQYNIHLYTNEETLNKTLDDLAPEESQDDPSSISVPYQPVGNQIVVQIVLEGGIRSTMLLDTGASITVIPGRLARQGRYPATGSIKLHTVSRQAVSAKLVRVNSLQLGPLSRQGLQLAVADIPSLNNKGIDGILGMDVLQGLSIHIKHQTRELLLN